MNPYFPPNSRYRSVDTATQERSDGRTIVYLRRRFLPPADRFHVLQEYTLAEGDRLDIIAAKYLGDPTLFWRLCDANNALDPAEIETPGRTLRITLPEGITGVAL